MAVVEKIDAELQEKLDRLAAYEKAEEEREALQELERGKATAHKGITLPSGRVAMITDPGGKVAMHPVPTGRRSYQIMSFRSDEVEAMDEAGDWPAFVQFAKENAEYCLTSAQYAALRKDGDAK